MTRKSHKNSKTGCMQCKRRHVKCDENHPRCLNCRAIGLKCAYKNGARLSVGEEQQISQKYELCLAIENGYLRSSDFPMQPLKDINVLHLKLFHHFFAKIAFFFWSAPGDESIYQDIIVDTALKHPHLMEGLLGFSALHMSEHTPELQDYYRGIATSYYNSALSSLKERLGYIDESSSIAVLLLSNLIGAHSFREVFASISNTTYSDFLKNMIQLINLQHGIRAIIVPWWQWFWSSELGPIIRNSHEFRMRSTRLNGSDTEMLKQFILSREMQERPRQIYLKEIQNLQIDYNQLRLNADGTSGSVHGLFTWLITVSNEFILLLQADQPDALLIFSFYGVILHHYRNFWLVQDAGRILVNFVIDRLGLDYSPCLRWVDQQTRVG
ncbi:uncharacterized protein V1516DRAFT_687231 [Lipomyces oligophaga]|uniref:uncharacterized protein n=1 Tax=Lipomyces oligophaga TaxID=45792 RepID=UPI0034CF98C1